MTQASPSTRPAGPAGRRRPTIRPVKVQRITELGPRLRRVTFGGASLSGFQMPRPGAHLKLFFGEVSPDAFADPNAPRPVARTYTPRRFDPVENELDVEFVLHGDGVASDWAAKASVGDDLLLAGPGGGHDISSDCTEMVLLVDETALPAAGMIIDALPANCQVTLVAEVQDAQDELVPSARSVQRVQWLHRLPVEAEPGSLLLAAARRLSPGADAQWFIACEAGAMRAIKTELLKERDLPREQLITRGYWKVGATDHPDRDTGD